MGSIAVTVCVLVDGATPTWTTLYVHLFPTVSGKKGPLSHDFSATPPPSGACEPPPDSQADTPAASAQVMNEDKIVNDCLRRMLQLPFARRERYTRFYFVSPT